MSRRYTSTTYEIAWKVKNEIPIGSTTWSRGSGEPRPTPSSASFIESTKNSRYLKTASSPRSNTTAPTRAALRRFSDGERAITCAANVFTTLEPTSSSTQRGSTQP